MTRIPVAVMGATGMVGQRFVSMLGDHPGMEVVALVASEKREGRKYSETVSWSMDREIPEEAAGIRISKLETRLEDLGARLVFGALPAGEAHEVEARLASEGAAVFTNASAHRMRVDVPILVPEVNSEHLDLVGIQRKRTGKNGFIVTNPNCSVSGLVMGLAPLKQFGVRKVFVSTYQALSGAGFDGVSSLEGLGNIIPYIHKEEGKVVEETGKILGSLEGEVVRPYPALVYPSCARVPVKDGHLEKVWIDLEETDVVKVADAIMEFRGLPQRLRLPTAPEVPLIMHTKENRPQPSLDVMAGRPERARGMAVSIGRLRQQHDLIGFTLLVHNTIRGAAGCSILNAELAISEGLVK